MFTVTDEDRQLRAVGKFWRERCKANLVQGEQLFQEVDVNDSGLREMQILRSSLEAILQERTTNLRLQLREDRHPREVPLVRVLVSQRAIVEAMASTRMSVIDEQNVRKLIHRFVSSDFEVSRLRIDFAGNGMGLTRRKERYTEFYLTIPVAD